MKGSKCMCDVEGIKHIEKVYYQQQSYSRFIFQTVNKLAT